MSQIWSIADEGGYLWAPNLSQFLRLQNLPIVKFRQLCDVKESDADGKPLVGKGRGEKWYWNVFSKLSRKGGPLDETQKMPTTGFTITQTSGTMTEYGNSVDWSGKLDDLSEQPIKELIKKELAIDVAEAFDVAAWTEFNKTLLWAQATSGTSTTAVTFGTDGIPSVTNNVAFGKGHVEPIVTYMKERNIPAYENGDYVDIGRPTAFITLKSDLEGIHTYVETGLAMIKNGEIGRYRGTRFIEQTHIPAGGAHDSTTYNPQTGTADAWNNAKSDAIFFAGADTVAEGIAIPEELRGKIPGDFGRDRGFAWYALEGFGLTHTDATNSRIVKWDSAA